MVSFNGYQQGRIEAGMQRRRKFAHAYNALLRARLAAGKNFAGIKHQAAVLAGFGLSSYSEAAAYKTRRCMASVMMKDNLVINELLILGLRPHPVFKNEWILSETAAPAQAEIEGFCGE